MQNNLIFYNIDENEEENCPELIINFCDERLKIGNAATKISITDAFRLGQFSLSLLLSKTGTSSRKMQKI
jgi:hypothetical protein